MLGAVGLAASENLPVMIQRKRMIHDGYEKHLANKLGVALQKAHHVDQSVWWANSCIVPAGCSAERIGMNLMKECPEIEIRPGEFFFFVQFFVSVRPCENEQIRDKFDKFIQISYVKFPKGFYPLHLQRPFREASILPCPNSELLYDRIICLPSSPNLSKQDVEHVLFFF